jgi:predicted nuclease of predicted toxin-antitoxin system
VKRLLADENVPGASVISLRTAGFDVVWMAEHMPGAPDVVVLELARAENSLLISFDRDHGELIYHRGLPAPPGVVYLRFVPADPAEPARIVHRLLLLEEIQLEGRFTVVKRDHVRQRPLP